MWKYLVYGSIGLLVLYLLSCNTNENFWWYSPCVYNAQNKMVCNPTFRGYTWFWNQPTRLVYNNDLRGDPYPYYFNRWGGHYRYPWL